MLMLLMILLPFISGFVILSGAIKDSRWLKCTALIAISTTALLAWICAFTASPGVLTLIQFNERLSIALRTDGLGKLFGLLLATLWIPSTFYAFECMKHESDERKFYSFFVMTLGATFGVAFSSNLLTMYLFYLCLSFSALPFVLHQTEDKAELASGRYLAHMACGGVAILIGILFLLNYASTLDFTLGGIFDAEELAKYGQPLQWTFLLTFLSFGVNATVFPLHAWFPASSSIVPTPITALLHAVVQVASGVFAIARIVYFTFGTTLLSGSFAQHLMMLLPIITILFASVMALRTPQLKRRLTYATVSNVSYIVFALALMSAEATSGGLMHLILHSLITIVLFFSVGAISHTTGVESVPALAGLGRRMPLTMACFTACALMLIGIPPLGSFTSKWHIADAAAQNGTPLAIIGMIVLTISQVLTALCLFSPIIAAYFKPTSEIDPHGDVLVGVVDGLDGATSDEKNDAHSHASIPLGQDEAGLMMTIPMLAITASALILSLFADKLYALAQSLM